MTSSLRRWLPCYALALLALAATITSIGNDFTYDDRGVILENTRVHALHNLSRAFFETYWPPKYGSDGYRPIIISLFTLEWVSAHGAPWLFHLINILLAVATALAVYWCASAILSRAGAWVAAALFAVHPVHVEVTGNIVGQSELIVALCVALAIGLYLRRRLAGNMAARDVTTISALFALGLLSKEHAVVLPALFVAAEVTVIRDQPWRVRIREIRLLFLALVAIALGYLFVRGLVTEDIAGFLPYPIFRFLRMTAFDRVATMMNEMPRIAQLLLFPTRLSADYSPNDVIVADGPALSQLPGAFICLGTALLIVVLRRRAPVVSFGGLWLIIAFLPVSNLIIPAGFVTAERTLFLPSVGVILAAGAVVEYISEHARISRRRLATGALSLLLVAGLARCIDRQRVWKNNDTFFVALMHDAPKGYRAHFLYAKHLGFKNDLHDEEIEYRRAIRIFPYDAGMTLGVADAYTRAGLCPPAVALFEWTYTVEPTMGDGRYEYVYCLAKVGRWADARREALSGMRLVAPADIKLMRAAVKEANLALGLPHK